MRLGEVLRSDSGAEFGKNPSRGFFRLIAVMLPDERSEESAAGCER